MMNIKADIHINIRLFKLDFASIIPQHESMKIHASTKDEILPLVYLHVPTHGVMDGK